MKLNKLKDETKAIAIYGTIIGIAVGVYVLYNQKSNEKDCLERKGILVKSVSDYKMYCMKDWVNSY